MTELKNDRFLKALLREPVDITPVWMMRQAGRYLPEYKKTRSQAGDFMSLCKNKELACEVTLQPLERYDLDAAILFSDILTVPDAMGLGLYFETGEGPRFKKNIRTEHDVDALPIINTDKDLSYVTDAVSTIRKELNGRVPLIGFSGSPWTLATYMVEGGSSKDFRHDNQTTNTGAYNASAFYVQLGYQLTAPLKAIYRYSQLDFEAGDLYFETLSSEEQYHNVFTLKYDLNEFNSVKVEADQQSFFYGTQGDIYTFRVQWSFMWNNPLDMIAD